MQSWSAEANFMWQWLSLCETRPLPLRPLPCLPCCHHQHSQFSACPDTSSLLYVSVCSSGSRQKSFAGVGGHPHHAHKERVLSCDRKRLRWPAARDRAQASCTRRLERGGGHREKEEESLEREEKGNTIPQTWPEDECRWVDTAKEQFLPSLGVTHLQQSAHELQPIARTFIPKTPEEREQTQSHAHQNFHVCFHYWLASR